MATRLDDLLDRVRHWSPQRQQDAIDILEALEKHDDELPSLASSELQDFERRLKQAYDEGIASGDAGEIDVDTLLTEFAERAGRGA